MKDIIRLATRNSPLALMQANIVRTYLLNQKMFTDIELVPMSTSGDTTDSVTFKNLGGKGLFLKELEMALANETVDLAVHSMKDVPAIIDKMFGLVSVMKRADPRDVFISYKYKSLDDIESGIIATSSPRRKTQLTNNYKNIRTVNLRGNINTRLKKLKDEELDGILLAKAGIQRMRLDDVISETLEIEKFVPSPGQGILCLEYLAKNKNLGRKLVKLVDEDTQICAIVERLFAEKMQGDCDSPIGANASIKGSIICITGYVSSIDGTKYIKNSVKGRKNDYKKLIDNLIETFIKLGSRKLI